MGGLRVVVIGGNIRGRENSVVVTVSLLLVLGPVRRPDVVRRSQDVQEGGGTSHALDSETEPVSTGLLVSPGQSYL